MLDPILHLDEVSSWWMDVYVCDRRHTLPGVNSAWKPWLSGQEYHCIKLEVVSELGLSLNRLLIKESFNLLLNEVQIRISYRL